MATVYHVQRRSSKGGKGGPNAVAGDEDDGMGGVIWGVIHRDEMGAFYFNLLSNSCLEILFQRLILLRISERVPFAITLCAGTVMLCSPNCAIFFSLYMTATLPNDIVISRIEKPNDIIAADLR